MSKIILPEPKITEPPRQEIEGSPIQAAADKVTAVSNEQAQAINTLGGEIRGGALVEVQNVPHLVSAGNIDAKASYSDLLKLQAQAKTDSTYDQLGTAAAQKIGGRKRKSRKNKKHGRKKRSSIRSNRRTLRKSRRIRHSRR